MGSASFTRGISWTSPSFRLGGVRRGNAPGNRSLYLRNRPRSAVRCYSPTLSRCGTAPSGRSFLPYSTSYKNSTGLPDVFNYASYVIFEPNVVPSGNSYLIVRALGALARLVLVVCCKSPAAAAAAADTHTHAHACTHTAASGAA